MYNPVSVASKSLVILLQKIDSRPECATNKESGLKIFREFQEENRSCYWNPALAEAVTGLEYVGWVKPGSLFVSGPELNLECLRGAWARRVLKAPCGYVIRSLGDVGGIEIQEVPQSQFISLPETVCNMISNLTLVRRPATLDAIMETICKQYTGMEKPRKDVLCGIIGNLVAEGKVYAIGDAYFLSNQVLYHQQGPTHVQQPRLGRHPNLPDPQINFLVPQLPKQTQQPFITGSHQFYNGMTPGYGSEPPSQPGKEMCSIECQTGASIVNSIPAFKPPLPVNKGGCGANRKDQANQASKSNKPMKAFQPPVIGGQKTSAPPDDKKETKASESPKKRRIFANIFRRRARSKPRDLVRKSEKSSEQGAKSRASSAEPSVDFPKSASLEFAHKPGPHVTSPDGAKHEPLITFSAQFPPPEWLVNPRYLNNQAPQPGTLEHRTKSPTLPAFEKSVWIDFEPPKELRITHKRSQRVSGVRSPPGRKIPSNRAGRGQKPPSRLSKYLSSSSEFLTMDSRSGARRRATERYYRRKQIPSRDHLDSSLLDSSWEGPPQEQNIQFSQFFLSPNVLKVDAPRTSTPSDEFISPKGSKDQQPPPKPENRARLGSGAAGDSAFSTSPLGTEDLAAGRLGSVNGGHNRYSSWSGSEMNILEPQKLSQIDRDLARFGGNLDHTYANLRIANSEPDLTKIELDHTYVNFCGNGGNNHSAPCEDVTQFENVSETVCESVGGGGPGSAKTMTTTSTVVTLNIVPASGQKLVDKNDNEIVERADPPQAEQVGQVATRKYFKSLQISTNRPPRRPTQDVIQEKICRRASATLVSAL